MSDITAPVLGIDSAVGFTITGANFPLSATFVSQVRANENTPVLVELSTADDTILRISETEIRLIFLGIVTENWKPGTVIFDVIRTDLIKPSYLGFRASVDFLRPITRPPYA